MRYRIEEPLFTTVLDDVSSLHLPSGSLYITGTSVEERSEHTAKWEAASPGIEFVRLLEEDRSKVTVSWAGQNATLRLRSANDFQEFLAQTRHTQVYLDITGLPHHVWAPILRAIRVRSEPSVCVYVEPGDYRFSATPTEASIFDLSESIQGIEPLPGFVSLAATPDEDGVFVPLLGFEGARFAFMTEAVQPNWDAICPIIGVPGFRPEYPFYSYLGNRLQLAETRAWQNVRYAAANCPFSVYHVLGAIAADDPTQRLRIAPIGTKPHALGAVLYCLDHPLSTEILYDHPVRKAKRTHGTSRVCLYDLSLLPPLRHSSVTARLRGN